MALVLVARPAAVADQQDGLWPVAPLRCWQALARDQALSTEELRTVVAEAGPMIPGASPADAVVDPRSRAGHGERHHDPAPGNLGHRCAGELGRHPGPVAPDTAYPAAGLRRRAGQAARHPAHETGGPGVGARHADPRAAHRSRHAAGSPTSCPRAPPSTCSSRSSNATAAAWPSWSTSTATSKDWSRWRTSSRRSSASSRPTRPPITHKDIHPERPGVFIVNASATIRALNRALQWQLPTDGPKTLNGLLLEQLETIPDPGTALKVGDYQFEVLQIADNAIRTVRVSCTGG